MSLRFEVEWDGLDGLRTYLARTIPQALKEAALEALDRAAEDARDRAKQLVPIDTGSLRRSIRKVRYARPAGNILYTGVRAGGYVRNPRTGRLVDYASFVEYGTSRQRPQPFLRPALRWASRRIPGYFWEALGRRVEVV